MTEKRNITTYDIVIIILIVGCLAFPDIDAICLGGQFLAIAYSILTVAKRKAIPAYIFNTLVWICAFFVLCIVSTLWKSVDNNTVISTSIAFVQAGCILLCLLVYCDSEKRFLQILRFVYVSGLIICLRFFISVPISQWGAVYSNSTLKGSIFSDNTTAMTLAYISILLIWEFFVYEKTTTRTRVLITAQCALVMFVVLMTGTKKGIFIFGIGVIILYLSQAKNCLKSVIRMAIILTCVYLVYMLLLRVPLFYNAIGYRVQMMLGVVSGGTTDASTRTRLLFAEKALEIFKANPILGVGIDGFRYENSYQFTYAHNNYLEMLADLGLVGFLMYYSIFVVWLKNSWSFAKVNVLPLTLLIIMLVMDWGSVSYSSETKAIWIAITILPLFVPSINNVIDAHEVGDIDKELI